MKKVTIVKTALCVGSVVVSLAITKTPQISAASLSPETGLAGISLSLDKYYTGTSTNSSDSKKNTSAERSLAGLKNIVESGADLEIRSFSKDTTVDELKPEESKSEILAPVVVPENNIETPAMQSVNIGTIDGGNTEDTLPTQEPSPTPEPTEEPKSILEGVGISVADNYVHVRENPDTESEILGKLYRGCAATILETEGEWVKIKSGKVQGYIKSEFLAIGFDGEELIEKYGTKLATINTISTRLREEPSTDAIILTLLAEGEVFEIVEEYDEWVKILIDGANEGEESTEGYVSKELVDISVEFEKAISIEEEEEKARLEEEARLAEEEAARRLEEKRRADEEAARQAAAAAAAAAAQQQQSSSQNSNSSSSSNNSSSSSSSNSSKSNSNSNSSNNSSSSNSNSNNKSSSNSSSQNNKKTEAADTPLQSGSGSGSEVANFAVKYVGRPYVYGGTSLTNGVDCSGFTMTIYSKFGISIPRTSGAQSSYGKKVDMGSLQAGDLVFYAKNGRVNHVALYIGGGQVVHASNPKNGIMISNVNYRTPYCARRVMQ